MSRLATDAMLKTTPTEGTRSSRHSDTLIYSALFRKKFAKVFGLDSKAHKCIQTCLEAESPQTSKPRVSNITFSTVTSATGLPTIAAEPCRPRSSRISAKGAAQTSILTSSDLAVSY
ncbi:hypothetical protein ANCCEY_03615 [Ancylostoma ceylanicum]|uniref:Uncharacterized protein n=1 Tax=Ancylostoma ceylanicum TaxID=53326 RepID=A0A0D6M1I8_9BILA|nr:hypothetical protein ANCCEY_03615 [Ancylostoma ceylanicum]